MKINLMDFKLLFTLLVCLCLFVSISNIYAMDIGDCADDSQSDGIDIDSLDDEESQGSFGYDEIDIIPSQSSDSDTMIISDHPADSDMDSIDLLVNDTAKRFHKHIFKKTHHHKLCKDKKHLTCYHRHHSPENSVLDNHVTDIDTNFSDDFYCYQDFYVNNLDAIFSNYTQLNTKGFIAIPRNLDEEEGEYLIPDLTFNTSQILDDEICENNFSFALNDSDMISYVDCESLSLPDTDLNAENNLTMHYTNCVGFDSYAPEIHNSSTRNQIILEDNLEYSIFADSISIIEESADTVENLCDLSVLTFNNSAADDNAEITITETVFTPESCIFEDNFESKELTDLFFDELSASHCTLTTFYEINFYILGNVPFGFIGAAPHYCSNEQNILIFWRNSLCSI